VLDWEEISEVAAFGGYPPRYPHWRFGMEYLELSRSYAYGLSKIYEMVINNDPTYAYLLAANHFMDQKLVMAHVCGHGDFFKHNFMFAHTNRKMVDEMANHATRVRRYMERYGTAGRGLLDRCLSIDNLIDYNAPHIVRHPTGPRGYGRGGGGAGEPKKLRSKGYMDSYINPPAMDAERVRLGEQRRRARSFPRAPAADVLLFLLEHAPLRTGSATCSGCPRGGVLLRAAGPDQDHERGVGQLLALDAHDRAAARALRGRRLRRPPLRHDGDAPGRLNPYKLGLELWRDIEERWNTGRTAGVGRVRRLRDRRAGTPAR
jgi:stage V sporulation protein R